MRQFYDLEWVPEEVVVHIVAVDWHSSWQALILTLDTGARLIDRFDRIDLVGVADDVAVTELVACVQRRGWGAVKLYGSDDFRAHAVCALLTAGILVENPPLSAREVEMLLSVASGPAP